MKIRKHELSLLGLVQLMLLVQMLFVTAFFYFMAYRAGSWQTLLTYSIGFVVSAFGVFLYTFINNRKISNH